MRALAAIVLLFVAGTQLESQVRQTDTRELTEEMRFSREKQFNSWAINVGYGAVFMYSDIKDFDVIPGSSIRFAPTVWISKQLSPSFAIDLQYINGEMYGRSEAYQVADDLYFKGEMNDITLNGVFYINQLREFPGPIKDRWNFYFKIGAGVNLFRSRLHFASNDEVVRENYFNMESTRYLVVGYEPYDDPYTKTDPELGIMVPMGFGAMYRINSSFDMVLESTMRFSANDNWDNVLTGSTNDRYLFTGLTLSYKIGKKDKRHMRWTYRGYGFSLFRKAQSIDPVAEEIRKLEDEIANLRKPVTIKDSVIVDESLTRIYETLKVRNIFFKPGAEIEFSTEDLILIAETVVEMKQNPGKYVDLYGYVDEGDPGDHSELSRIQCEKIRDVMVNQMAANPNFIRIFARGSEGIFKHASSTSSEVAKRSNRRVDIVFRN